MCVCVRVHAHVCVVYSQNFDNAIRISSFCFSPSFLFMIITLALLL